MARNTWTLKARHWLCVALLSCFPVLLVGFEWIESPPSTTFAQIGKNITLIWKYDLSEKLVVSQLRYNGEKIAIRIPNSNKYTIESSSEYDNISSISGKKNVTFILFAVPLRAGGKYCLEVDYRQGSASQGEKRCTNLEIFDYPLIKYSSYPNNITATVSDTVEVYCNASGIPNPKVNWVKLSNHMKVLTTSNLYQIHVKSSEDDGEYICNATNPHGWDERHFFLTVQYLPNITEIQRSIYVTEDKNVTLACVVRGNPLPSIVWTFQEKTIGNTSIIQLTSIGRHQSGEYKCTAKNKLGIDSKTTQVNVLYMPQITFLTRPNTVNETKNVTIYCNATGNPIPVVKLLKDGSVERSGVGAVNLTFLNVGWQDAGDYNCTATNSEGTDSRKTNLVIQHAPRIIKDHPVINATEEESVTLICLSKGYPPPEVKWTRANRTISNNSNHVLPFVNRADAGYYKCIATNIMGKDKHSIQLVIFYSPSIDFWVKELTVNEGSFIDLYCNATGHPNPMVTWVKKENMSNVLESGQGQANYSITNARKTDTGKYLCSASNAINTTSSVVTSLTVHYKPTETKLITSTGNNSVIVNETLVLYCSAKAVPPATWYIFKHTGGNPSNSTNNTYIINRVKTSDEGTYSCKPGNLLGEGESYSLNITVLAKQPTFLRKIPRNITINETETISLECVAHGYPTPTITWTKVGDNSFIKTGNRFTKHNASRSDDGTYKCTANNKVGKPVSAQAKVNVNYEPDIIKTKDEETVKIGGNVNMSCSAKGKPIPDVQWFRGDSGEVSPVGVGMATLLLGNVNRMNAGNYICRASNLLGNAEKTSTLIVLHPPVQTNLTTETGSNSVVVNQKLILHCLTIAIPSPTWYIFEHNGANLTNSTNNTYIIDRVSLSDEGTYSCTPGNLLGEGESSSLNITVLVPPILDEKPSNLTVTLSGTITLKCIASGKPSAKITWTKDNSPRVIHTGEIFNKTNVKRCDVGVYRCTAKNNVGRPVSAQAFVAVNSLPEIPRILKFDQSEDGVEIHWEQPTINCSLAITGYIARVRKKDSQSEWIECPAKKSTGKMWTCSVGDLESNTLYNVQIIAKNRVGQGEPAKGSFKTDVGADASGTSGKSKGGPSKQTYIIIGACAGVLLLLIVLIAYRKCGKKDGASLLAPIELNPANGPSQPNAYQVQNAHDGPMSASQETLEVNEIQVNGTEEKGKDVNGIEGGQSKEKGEEEAL